MEFLAALYVLGILVFLVGCLVSGKDHGESTTRFIVVSVGVSIFWLPGILLLVLFFVWWGIVGD